MPDLSVKTWIKKYGGYVALGMVLVLLVCSLKSFGSGREVYSVLCLGDSIMGNVRGESSIPGVLSELTGEEVLNGGFGGMALGCVNDQRRGDVKQDGFSLVGITESVLAEDFSRQKASLEASFVMDYYPETIQDFEQTSWDDVEVIVIEYGVNDYLMGMPLDNEESPYDIYSFGGALRYSLKLLTEQYGDKQIVLCTPTFCWFPEREEDCRVSNGYGSLKDYVELEKKIAKEFGIKVLDNYHESGIGPENESPLSYTEDGVHLNEAGRRLVAERLAQCIGR